MGFFNRKPKEQPKQRKPYRKREPLTPKEEQERLENKKAWEGLIKQMRDNPELEKQFVFSKMGIKPPAPPDPIEAKKQELRGNMITEACKLIEEDEDLRREYAEAMLGEIITNKARGRSRHEPSYDMEIGGGGSSLSQALEELDSLSELKIKLAELGMGDSENGKGFLGGLQLKDILAILPQIIPYISGGQRPANTIQEPMYVVQVNGNPTQVSESQYQQLLQEGRIRPVAELAPPQPKQEKEPEKEKQEPQDMSSVAELQEEDVKIELPPLDFILEKVAIEDLTYHLESDPDEFVIMLQGEQEDGSEWAKFFWGLLSNATYEGLVNIAQHYKDDERATAYIELIQSNKEWIESVISRIKEIV